MALDQSACSGWGDRDSANPGPRRERAELRGGAPPSRSGGDKNSAACARVGVLFWDRRVLRIVLRPSWSRTSSGTRLRKEGLLPPACALPAPQAWILRIVQGVPFGPEDQVQDRPLPPAHLPSELGVLIKAIAKLLSVVYHLCLRVRVSVCGASLFSRIVVKCMLVCTFRIELGCRLFARVLSPSPH